MYDAIVTARVDSQHSDTILQAAFGELVEQRRGVKIPAGAMDAAQAEARAWSARARSALELLPDHPLRDMLDGLADYVVARLT